LDFLRDVIQLESINLKIALRRLLLKIFFEQNDSLVLESNLMTFRVFLTENQ